MEPPYGFNYGMNIQNNFDEEKCDEISFSKFNKDAQKAYEDNRNRGLSIYECNSLDRKVKDFWKYQKEKSERLNLPCKISCENVLLALCKVPDIHKYEKKT